VSGYEMSRSLSQIGKPTSAIIMTENNQGNMLGRWTPSVDYPPGFRNRYTIDAQNMAYGPHAQGKLSNFLLADGHVEALSWRDTATKPDGTFYYVGPDFRDTMWDTTK
jgi:prepilin-type processing-associated H-X9-DG protein